VIVVGHYGCSGVQAAMRRTRVGLADNWLRHVQDVHEKHHQAIASLSAENLAADRLCELNVIEQVQNVCQTSIARDAWDRGQELHVHGWIYGIADGLARDLHTTVSDFRDAGNVYRAAVAKLTDPRR
jgi:carbonic anhydrase